MAGFGNVEKVIEAEKFVLKSSDGRTLGELGSESGGPSFSLYDQSGKSGIRLMVAKEGGCGVELLDENGRIRLNLILDIDDGSVATPSLCLVDKNGDGVVSIHMLPTGMGEFLILDQDRKPIVELPPLPG